ncbi:glycosyl hydrolase [Limoniibacter endophyticus]|uniref:Glycosyl hydrolase n=1 Tax=Limoniibacter endophyticus TaxID=1565040 RepID=A0A8J3DRG7_9HYPH|nr:glycosyl hydrolase [Limoniibacter endophyticus]
MVSIFKTQQRNFSRLLAAGVLIAALQAPAGAADISLSRGLNMDQWVTWPAEDKWGDESALFPFPEWRKFVSQERLASLRKDGFDFVRMPVDPSPFLSPRSAHFHDRLFDEVFASVQALLAADLKVIVDLHLISRADNAAVGMEGVLSNEDRWTDYIAVVSGMAEKLSALPASSVALELMNEPGTACDAEGASNWQLRQKSLHAAAREAAPALPIVLTGGCAGTVEGLVALDPKAYDDDNVLWTFHNYQPFLLTHQGAQWAGDLIRYVKGLSYPPSGPGKKVLEARLRDIEQRISKEAPVLRRAGMRAWVREQMALIDTPQKLERTVAAPFDMVANWAKQNNVKPGDILLGEFGMIRQEYQGDFIMPPQDRAAYVKDIIGHAEKAGYAWAIWSYGGAFGIVESFDGKDAEPDVMNVVRTLPERFR